MPEKIYGVEIQSDACELASQSVERNQLKDTICIVHHDIKALPYLHPPRGLDPVSYTHLDIEKSGTGSTTERRRCNPRWPPVVQTKIGVVVFGSKFSFVH